jgi:hypothetical protein
VVAVVQLLAELLVMLELLILVVAVQVYHKPAQAVLAVQVLL